MCGWQPRNRQIHRQVCWKSHSISGVVGKQRNIGLVGFLGNVEPKWCRKYRKWLCCKISVTKSKLKASLAVWRNLLPYIFQGGLQPGSPHRRAAPGNNYFTWGRMMFWILICALIRWCHLFLQISRETTWLFDKSYGVCFVQRWLVYSAVVLWIMPRQGHLVLVTVSFTICVILREIDFLLQFCWSIPCLHPSWNVHTWIEICASLNHRKKTKADGSRLIPRKHTETLVLLSVW